MCIDGQITEVFIIVTRIGTRYLRMYNDECTWIVPWFVVVIISGNKKLSGDFQMWWALYETSCE